jgi:hypothetical protein
MDGRIGFTILNLNVSYKICILTYVSRMLKSFCRKNRDLTPVIQTFRALSRSFCKEATRLCIRHLTKIVLCTVLYSVLSFKDTYSAFLALTPLCPATMVVT